DALAIQRRTNNLQKIPRTLAAIQLSPRAAVRMTIRADIAEPHAAPIRTVGLGAELLRGVHLARTSPVGGDRRWGRQRWWCHGFLCGLLTGHTRGLADAAGKRL